MTSTIVSFDRDDDGHWVCTLSCGHRLHMRHDPPWTVRPWVLTAEGRASRVGVAVACSQCDAGPRSS